MQNTRRPMAAGKSSRVDAEVARLLSKPKVDKEEFMRLRNKIDDQELVDQIQMVFSEKMELVEKRAKAFATKIMEKYGMTNQPFSQLLVKAHKYAKKYELSEAEITAFQRILEQELAGADRPDVPRVTTNMSKVLGDITIDTKGFGMKVDDADYKNLQDILQMEAEGRPLHAQVILQSLSYKDMDANALNGLFRPENGHNAACHVHPVVAALFMMKENVVDQHFLFSSLANIVKSRYNQEPFKTKPDYELFYSLVTDPNDIVCDSRSPLKDLKNRTYLQQQLWRSVLALRNGQYYNCDQLDLLKAIDMCRLNKYDTPDLVYGRYDGTVIKRLFAAFSFRPTMVLTMPVPTIVSNNPYFQSQTPTVSAIPMINLRLPDFGDQYFLRGPGIGMVGANPSSTLTPTQGPINLESALGQSQIFFENGALVSKNTQVVHSRGVIAFFVDRRKHNLDIKLLSNPLHMVQLPSALSGFERVNDTDVEYEVDLQVGEAVQGTSGTSKDNFKLRSIVCANTHNEDGKALYVGSRTVVVDAKDTANTFVYNPMKVVRQGSGVAGPSTDNHPVTKIAAGEAITNIAKKDGVIFIYQKA